ncbi:MAG: efflux transporter outer membrane subunit [Pseudomonadota bacterium]
MAEIGRRTVCTLLALVAAAGCTPARREPVDTGVRMPDRFRGGREPATGPAAMLDGWQWWPDVPLRAAIAEALAGNRDLQIAVARIEEARALVGPAEYAELPRLVLGADASREQLPQRYRTVLAPGADRALQLRGVTAGFSYEADVWGRLKSLEFAARADFLASRYARETVAIGLAVDVALAWYDIVALREQRAIVVEALASREAFTDLVGRRHEAGRGSALELARAQAAMLGVAARLPAIDQQVAQAENRISLLLGRPLARAEAVVPAGATLIAPLEVPEGLPSSLLERRPDLMAAREELEAATFRAEAQRAALMPTFSLTGVLGLQSRSLADLVSSSASTWTLGANALLPVIDASRNRFLAQAQEARARQALLRYRRGAEAAVREVSDALIARARQADLTEALDRQLAALVRAEALAQARYRAGAAAYFEVLDAQTERLAARLAHTEARRGLIVATLGLYKALGGGWDPESFLAGGHTVP